MSAEPNHDQGTVVRLHDGESLVLSAAETELVYDELWLLANRMHGALTAAVKLANTATWELLHGEERLTEEETVALRAALQRTSSD